VSSIQASGVLPIFCGDNTLRFFRQSKDCPRTIEVVIQDATADQLKVKKQPGFSEFKKLCEKVNKLINNRGYIDATELASCGAYKSLSEEQKFNEIRLQLMPKERGLQINDSIATMKELEPGDYRPGKARIDHRPENRQTWIDRKNDFEGYCNDHAADLQEHLDIALVPKFSFENGRYTSQKQKTLMEKPVGSFEYQAQQGKKTLTPIYMHWRQSTYNAKWGVDASEAKQAGLLTSARYIEKEGSTARVSFSGRMNTMDRMLHQCHFLIDELDDYIANHAEPAFQDFMRGDGGIYRDWFKKWSPKDQQALTYVLSRKLPQGIDFLTDDQGVCQFAIDGRPKLKIRMIDHSLMTVGAWSDNDQSDEPLLNKSDRLNTALRVGRLLLRCLFPFIACFIKSVGAISPDYEKLKALFAKRKFLSAALVIFGRMLVVGFWVEWALYAWRKEKWWSQSERALCGVMTDMTKSDPIKIGSFECVTEVQFAHMPFNRFASSKGFKGDDLTDGVEKYLLSEISKLRIKSEKTNISDAEKLLEKRIKKIDDLYKVGFKPESPVLPEEQLVARLLLAEELNIRLCIHCKSGKDRTGWASMIAVALWNYREVKDCTVEDWPKYCKDMVADQKFKDLVACASSLALRSAEVLAGKSVLSPIDDIQKRLAGVSSKSQTAAMILAGANRVKAG